MCVLCILLGRLPAYIGLLGAEIWDWGPEFDRYTGRSFLGYRVDTIEVSEGVELLRTGKKRNDTDERR